MDIQTSSGRAADTEGLQPDGVGARLDAADLDVHEIAGLEDAVRRRAVDER